MYGHNNNKMDTHMRSNLRTISVITAGTQLRNFNSGLEDSPTSARKSPLGFQKNDIRTSTMVSKDFDMRKSIRASQEKKKAHSVMRQGKNLMNKTI